MDATAGGALPLPQVVRLRRTRDGTVVQDCQLYVGRALHMGGWHLAASPWANPYKLALGEKDTPAARQALLDRYEVYVRGRPDLMTRLPELAGRTLGCFCKPKLCHGDVLVKLVGECQQQQQQQHAPPLASL